MGGVDVTKEVELREEVEGGVADTGVVAIEASSALDTLGVWLRLTISTFLSKISEISMFLSEKCIASEY